MLLSWPQTANMMRMFLDDARSIDKDTLVFVGESSPLSFLLRHLQDSGHVTMNEVSQRKTDRPPPSTPSSESTSTADSTISNLPPGTLDALVSSYFAMVHPFYPVIHRKWFADKYKRNEVPLLLLNAVCFAACYHCEQLVVFRAGYAKRQDAKDAFYAEAKRIFDEEQETDILIVLQAAVLLSFYGGRTKCVWNNRSWLAIAVTIAEDLGLHRSTLGLKMKEEDKTHLRMVWWCMVFRDLMTSLNWGRPHKTCDPRSDFEMLRIEEFEIDEDPSDAMFGKRDMANCHFLVENAKLNMLMIKVFQTRYTPRSDVQPDLDALHAELGSWRDNLPECLNWSEHPNSLAAMYACMVYHHMLIFIFRPLMADSADIETCSLEITIKAASQIASLVGRLGIVGTIRIPQDMYPIIVTAMAILLKDVQATGSVESKLQLDICFMTLTHSQENWDHGPWIVSLFNRMLEQPNQPAVEDTDSLQGLFSNSMDAFSSQIPL